MKNSPLFDGKSWTREPSLDDLFSDPILHAVAKRDGVSVDHLRIFAADMGRRLARVTN